MISGWGRGGYILPTRTTRIDDESRTKLSVLSGGHYDLIKCVLLYLNYIYMFYFPVII